MRRSIPSILRHIANGSIAAGLGAMTLFGGAAHAETVQQRAQAEMNKGLDYVAAQQVAEREIGPLYAPELAADARQVEAALNLGKDYISAVETNSHRIGAAFSPELVAKAQLVGAQLNQGKDYVAAWAATDNVAPRIEASPSVEVVAERGPPRSKQ